MIDQNQLEQYVTEELSIRQIASKVEYGYSTVKYWLKRYNLKTNPKNGRKRHIGDDRYIESICKTHGETTFIYEKSKNGYRCKKCRSGKVSEDRRRLKRELVEHAGGKCYRCGYDKSIWSLEFHRRDPDKKTGDMGHLIRDRKKQLAFQELEKCDLVCSNCHGELEEQKWTTATG